MSRIGKKIIRGLRDFNQSLKRGDAPQKDTWHRVVLDTKPGEYDARLDK